MNLPFFSGFWNVFRNVSRQMAAVLTQYELMEIAALKVALGDAAWLQEVVMRMPEVVKDMELAMNQWPGRRLEHWKNVISSQLTKSFFRGVYRYTDVYSIPQTSDTYCIISVRIVTLWRKMCIQMEYQLYILVCTDMCIGPCLVYCAISHWIHTK